MSEFEDAKQKLKESAAQLNAAQGITNVPAVIKEDLSDFQKNSIDGRQRALLASARDILTRYKIPGDFFSEESIGILSRLWEQKQDGNRPASVEFNNIISQAVKLGAIKKDLIEDIKKSSFKERRQTKKARSQKEDGTYAYDGFKVYDTEDDGSWPDADQFGNPKDTIRNVIVALKRLNLFDKFQFDTFKQRFHIGANIKIENYKGEECIYKNSNSDPILAAHLERRFAFRIDAKKLGQYITEIASNNEINPIMNYFNSLKWDGVPRLEEFPFNILKAKDTILNRTYFKLMMVAAVRRVKVPGTKFDTCLIMEGPQGLGKSSVLRLLFGDEYFTATEVVEATEKELVERTQGKMCVELEELTGFHRKSIEKVKKLLSSSTAYLRLAYAARADEFASTCVFVGTTNQEKYLFDETGGRRFWPMRLGYANDGSGDEAITGETNVDPRFFVDLEAAKEQRDQLWAEAVHLEKTGMELFLPRDLWEATGELQSSKNVYVGMYFDEFCLLPLLGSAQGLIKKEHYKNMQKDGLWTRYMISPNSLYAYIKNINPDTNAESRGGRSTIKTSLLNFVVMEKEKDKQRKSMNDTDEDLKWKYHSVKIDEGEGEGVIVKPYFVLDIPQNEIARFERKLKFLAQADKQEVGGGILARTGIVL